MSRFTVAILASAIAVSAVGPLAAQQAMFAFAGASTALGEDPALQYVVERYNKTRPWLSKPLGRLDIYPLGFSAGVGLNTRNIFLFDVSLSMIQSPVARAEGIPVGAYKSSYTEKAAVLSQAAVDFVFSPFGFDELRLGAGLGLGLIDVKIMSSVDGAPMEAVFNEYTGELFVFGQALFWPLEGIGLIARPGIVFPMELNYSDLSEALNPYTWTNDSLTGSVSTFIHFRLDLGIALQWGD
jgi:hypothetical protein